MLTEWRVGYLSSQQEELNAAYFEWYHCATLDRGYQRFHEYKTKFWDKELIIVLMLVRHDFDPWAGTFESTVLESMQKKLTPTVHYNKKDGVATAKSKLMAQLNDVASSAQMINHAVPIATIPVGSIFTEEMLQQMYNSTVTVGPQET